MELALAELALEEPHEADDDVDFVNKEEEDVFESDFVSTDEEAPQEADDAGDSVLQEEERRERKAARARADKATALAHARQRVTFDPVAVSSPPKPQTKRTKRRVLLGVAVDAQTGAVIEDGAPTSTKRQSQRRHTVMNTTATVIRMKDAEEKKAALPKKPKVLMKLPTQDELIARALDTEEGNILEHRNYLRLEEEKRARARVVRQSIEGPVLRWISRKERVKIPPGCPASGSGASTSQCKFIYATASPGVAAHTTGAGSAGRPATQFIGYIPSTVQGIPDQNARASAISHTPPAEVSVTSTLPSGTFLPTTQPTPEERTESVCKNYVVHELAQTHTTKKPPWTETMYAMFGDHVAWEELRVYTGKQRPLARPVRTCPITGLAAPYLDPRTNVPFASVGAFQTLTKILSHEYAWSDALGFYVGPRPVAQEEELERPAKKRRAVAEAGGQYTLG